MTLTDLDRKTPYVAILFNGERHFAIRFEGPIELATLLSHWSRRELDAVLRHGPERYGVNPRHVLAAIDKEIRGRVEETAARMKAQRHLEGAGRAPRRDPIYWLRLAGIV